MEMDEVVSHPLRRKDDIPQRRMRKGMYILPSLFTTANIAAGKKVILFFYSPTCPHCRAQMREILKHIDQYKDLQLCVLTWSDFPAMKKFNTYFNLQKYPNIITGIDTGFVVPKIYGITAVPFMAAFDRDKRLKSAYLGRMSSKTLLRAVNP